MIAVEDVDLKDFLSSYAEDVPTCTVFKCTILQSDDRGRVRLNMRPPKNLRFIDKAYDLFRVVEQENGTVDILLGNDKLVCAANPHTCLAGSG